MKDTIMHLSALQTLALGVVTILAAYIIFIIIREMVREPKFTAVMLSVLIGCVTVAFVVGELVVYMASVL
jgi:hypothetical protein